MPVTDAQGRARAEARIRAQAEKEAVFEAIKALYERVPADGRAAVLTALLETHSIPERGEAHAIAFRRAIRGLIREPRTGRQG